MHKSEFCGSAKKRLSAQKLMLRRSRGAVQAYLTEFVFVVQAYLTEFVFVERAEISTHGFFSSLFY